MAAESDPHRGRPDQHAQPTTRGTGRRARGIGAAAMIAGLVVTGCSTNSTVLDTPTAKVLINGKAVGEPLAVGCNQVRQAWFIESASESPGFSAQFRTGETVAAQSAQFNDLGGFTGSYWDGTVGKAEGGFADGTFTVRGTALGFFQDDPSHTAMADFEIRADC